MTWKRAFLWFRLSVNDLLLRTKKMPGVGVGAVAQNKTTLKQLPDCNFSGQRKEHGRNAARLAFLAGFEGSFKIHARKHSGGTFQYHFDLVRVRSSATRTTLQRGRKHQRQTV